VIERRANVRALLVHARSVPEADRRRFGVDVREALAGRGFVFETCHRVEGYATGEVPVTALDQVHVPVGGLDLVDESAIRHAIGVATGRDSVVVGEDQVLHQLRESVDTARSAGLDPTLERLFATSLRAGRRARSWRRGPTQSLATVALSEVERRSGTIRRRRVLIVGAGRMGRVAARAASAAGADVFIANRSAGEAQQLARDTGARLVPFDPGAEIASFAAILIALSGPWALGPASRPSLADSSSIVVDLSVPTALDAELARGIGTRLVVADDLARLDRAVASPEANELRRLEGLIDRTTDEFLAWLEGRDARAAAAALASKADAERAAELESLWRQLPDLEPEARMVIDEMTRHLAARLLREPFERLGNDPDGRTERAVREVFAL